MNCCRLAAAWVLERRYQVGNGLQFQLTVNESRFSQVILAQHTLNCRATCKPG